MGERLTHIDNAKAIGMMLIVASHIIPAIVVTEGILYRTWTDILGSFYVPLFFILSGAFESSTFDKQKYIRRVLKLAKYCLIFYVFGTLTDGLINSHWSFTSYKSQTTIWFLITLLWMTLIVGATKVLQFKWLIYSLLVGGGIVLSYKSKSFMYLGQAGLCLPFYLFGFYAKTLLKQANINLKLLIGAFIIWIACFLLFYNTQNISLNQVTQNYIAFYIEAICGSIVVIELCKLFNWSVIAYYGRNSIVPMMVQIPIIWMLSKFWVIHSVTMYLLCVAVAILITWLCIPLFRNKKYDIFK